MTVSLEPRSGQTLVVPVTLSHGSESCSTRTPQTRVWYSRLEGKLDGNATWTSRATFRNLFVVDIVGKTSAINDQLSDGGRVVEMPVFVASESSRGAKSS